LILDPACDCCGWCGVISVNEEDIITRRNKWNLPNKKALAVKEAHAGESYHLSYHFTNRWPLSLRILAIEQSNGYS
jgi:hypothetical protein